MNVPCTVAFKVNLKCFQNKRKHIVYTEFACSSSPRLSTMSKPPSESLPVVSSQNCILLLWTSIWISIPMAYSLNRDIILALFLAITFVASMCHWSCYSQGSFARHTDRIGAMCSISWVNLHAHDRAVWVLTAVSVFFFSIGYYRFHKDKYMVIFHVLFRYFAFVAIMIYLKSNTEFAVYSIAYWLQVMYLLHK